MNIVSKSELERRLKIDAALLLNMANHHRLRVLLILREGEDTVNSMASKLGLSQSALSQHLAKLRKGKLVETRREAQTIYYSCNLPAALRLLDALAEIYSAPAAKLARAS